MDANHTEDLRSTPTGPTRELAGRRPRHLRRLRHLGVAAVVTAALVGGAVATAGNAAAQPNTQSCIAYFAAFAASDMSEARQYLAEATTDDAEGNYTAAVAALDNYHSAIGSYSGARYAQSLC
jgi:hypothetical protein